MYLVTAATSFELDQFLTCLNGAEKKNLCTLVTGIGPVEAAVRTSCCLSRLPGPLQGVFNLGIGGAYIRTGLEVGLLDLCIATGEVLGDLGICFSETIEALNLPGLETNTEFDLDSDLLQQVCTQMDEKRLHYKAGNFVTVNCVSATEKRGRMLAAMHGGICENMEGAAVARACREFDLPLVEIRCISNMVEDRNREAWKIREAAVKCGATVAECMKGLMND